jgi:hypothetical protein
MKANEAPKKIYIPRLEGNKSFVHEWSATKFRTYFNREVAENVEYTRTDTFIEKSCDAYCKVCKMPNCRRNECKMIDDFKGHLENI